MLKEEMRQEIKGDPVAWFYFQDYLFRWQVGESLARLKRIIKLLRGWETVARIGKLRYRASRDGVIREFIWEIWGITDEFTEEHIVVYYRNGEVWLYRQ